jgi:hypothetical protein
VVRVVAVVGVDTFAAADTTGAGGSVAHLNPTYELGVHFLVEFARLFGY